MGDECFSCSEAVAMAALRVADDFKAASSTWLSRVQAGAHRRCASAAAPAQRAGPCVLMPAVLLACRFG